MHLNVSVQGFFPLEGCPQVNAEFEAFVTGKTSRVLSRLIHMCYAAHRDDVHCAAQQLHKRRNGLALRRAKDSGEIST